MYTGMLRSRLLDQRLLPLQRQGRIGFYIGATGQEAGVIAGAHAIGPEDWFVPGLRETSAAPVPRASRCARTWPRSSATPTTSAQGRQMPCHSGSRASHHIVMSSCVSSQLPHATGIAMAAKITRRHGRGAGLLRRRRHQRGGLPRRPELRRRLQGAGGVRLPEQPVGHLHAARAADRRPRPSPSRGWPTACPRCASTATTCSPCTPPSSEAVDRARAGGGPTLHRGLTYRLGAHSSSDDPTRYRDEAEPEAWREKDPAGPLPQDLAGRPRASSPRQSEAALAAELEREIREAIAAEEAAAPPPLPSLIEDVYAEPTPAPARAAGRPRARARQQAAGVTGRDGLAWPLPGGLRYKPPRGSGNPSRRRSGDRRRPRRLRRRHPPRPAGQEGPGGREGQGRRHLPQRRLHPVQGADQRLQAVRQAPPRRRHRHPRRQPARRHGARCRPGRTRWSAS